MAITKIEVNTTTNTLSALLSVLQEHAVPAYFDSVTLAEDGTYISCFCGDAEFLRICKYAGYSAAQSGAGILVTTASGASQTLSLVYGSDYVGAVCVCSSCIALIPKSAPQDFGLICKDTDGNTCFYTLSTLNGNNWGNSTNLPSSATNCNVWAISCADTEIRSYNAYLNNADNTTGRMLGMPIITAEHRLKDVWFPAIRQLTEITEPIEVDVDGTAYMLNRGFIARNE